jgi:hypothetical protein
MKRIIDGVTYNTDTATLIARAERIDDYGGVRPEERFNFWLYQTRGGAFFIHTHHETSRKDIHGGWVPTACDEFEPMTRDQAHRWVMTGETEMLNDVFGDPPEAADKPALGATLYIRVPASLKDRLEVLARHDDLSLNAWTMRCVERCADLDKVGALIGEIMQTGQSAVCGVDSTHHYEMIRHMHQQAEAIGVALGWRGKALENLCSDASALAAAGISDNRRWPLTDEESEKEYRERVRIQRR